MKPAIYTWSDAERWYCRPHLPPPYGMLPLHSTPLEDDLPDHAEIIDLYQPESVPDLVSAYDVAQRLAQYFGVPVINLDVYRDVPADLFEALKGPAAPIFGAINGAPAVEPMSLATLEAGFAALYTSDGGAA